VFSESCAPEEAVGPVTTLVNFRDLVFVNLFAMMQLRSRSGQNSKTFPAVSMPIRKLRARDTSKPASEIALAGSEVSPEAVVSVIGIRNSNCSDAPDDLRIVELKGAGIETSRPVL
jgi:hypothetical protein